MWDSPRQVFTQIRQLQPPQSPQLEKKKEKDEVELRKHGGQGLQGAARQTTKEEDERQFRGTLQPRKKGLTAAGRGKQVKKRKGLIKKTKAATV